MRPTWSGTLVFGLVAIPVTMHSAVRRRSESASACFTRRTSRRSSTSASARRTATSVPWDEIVKGYEYKKGKYVVLDRRRLQGGRARVVEDHRDPRLRAVPTRSTRATSRRRTTCCPGKGGDKAYALLREAIRKTGKVGIGKVTMRRTRTTSSAVKVVGDALVLEIMRFADELVDAAEFSFPDGEDRAPAGAADGRAAHREPRRAVRPVEVQRRVPRQPAARSSRPR